MGDFAGTGHVSNQPVFDVDVQLQTGGRLERFAADRARECGQRVGKLLRMAVLDMMVMMLLPMLAARLSLVLRLLRRIGGTRIAVRQHVAAGP